MKSLQLLTFAAISFILSLLVYGLNYEDPIMVQYEECITKCMLMDTATSEEKLFTRFPQLKQALDCINKANHLKSQMNSIMRGPSPDVQQDQGNNLTTMKQQWKDLKAKPKVYLIRFSLQKSQKKESHNYNKLAPPHK